MGKLRQITASGWRKSTDRIAAAPHSTIMPHVMVLRIVNISTIILALATAWPISIQGTNNALPAAAEDADRTMRPAANDGPDSTSDDETDTDAPPNDLTAAVSFALPPDQTGSGTRSLRSLAPPRTRVEGRMGRVANDAWKPFASPISATLAADARWATRRLFVVAPQLRANAPPATA